MNASRPPHGNFINYLLALVAIFSLNFILPRMMPGDPLHAIYGDEALVAMTPQMEAYLTEKFALNQPWSSQFTAYASGLLQGDLGYSYYYKDQVSTVIMGALPWTLLLAGLALIIATILGTALGIESGYRRGRPLDRGLIASLMFLSGFPDFFVGILLLLIFGVCLGVAPLSGATTPYSGATGLAYALDVAHHLILPLSALVLVQLGGIYLLTRNTMVSVLKERFIMTARAKGCSDSRIRYEHAGRNSLLPVVTATGMRLPQIITGALFIEIVFSYPGVGSLLSSSLDARDYPLIQGILLLVTVAVLTANLGVDLLYRRLDPRVRYAH
ncbi:MAG: ABC transporter permease [Methanotrichaceae archaeon]|nr:ABC transporter permease [Methanotrichaceae archaeon]